MDVRQQTIEIVKEKGLRRLPEPVQLASGAMSDVFVDGKSLVFLTIQHRWLDGLEALLQRGASPTKRDQHGYTPLQQAARQAFGKPNPIVDALRRAGAPVDPISGDAIRRQDAESLRRQIDRQMR